MFRLRNALSPGIPNSLQQPVAKAAAYHSATGSNRTKRACTWIVRARDYSVTLVRKHELFFSGSAFAPQNLVAMRIAAETVDYFFVVFCVPGILFVVQGFE
jgi:hypothetical protein